MSLEIYYDDSREHDKVLVISGYGASRAAWQRFALRWAEVLQEGQPWPELKMSSHSGNGRKLEKLLRVIEDHVFVEITCVIDCELYNKVAEDSGLAITYPYHMAMSWLLRDGLRLLEEHGITIPSRIFIDEQKREDKILLDSWNLLRTVPKKKRRLLGNPPTFCISRETPPIQAGDFIAWWTRKAFLAGDDLRQPIRRFRASDGYEFTSNVEIRRIILYPCRADYRKIIDYTLYKLATSDLYSLMPPHVEEGAKRFAFVPKKKREAVRKKVRGF